MWTVLGNIMKKIACALSFFVLLNVIAADDPAPPPVQVALYAEDSFINHYGKNCSYHINLDNLNATQDIPLTPQNNYISQLSLPVNFAFNINSIVVECPKKSPINLIVSNRQNEVAPVNNLATISLIYSKADGAQFIYK